jgi:hypothetical protein
MEQDPSKPKIVVEEIQEGIKNSKEDLDLVQEQLDYLLNDLTHSLEQIEGNKDYLEYMQYSNDLKNETSNKPNTLVKEYSEEEIEKTKLSIKKFEESLEAIHFHINKFNSYKEKIKDQIVRMEEAEQRFRNLLVKIPKHLLN